jgi:hypothetical protein
MRRQLELVLAGAAGALQAGSVLAAAGSLTSDFRVVERASGGHVAWVFASGPTWTDTVAAALADGAAAVVVDHPSAPAPADIARLAALAGPPPAPTTAAAGPRTAPADVVRLAASAGPPAAPATPAAPAVAGPREAAGNTEGAGTASGNPALILATPHNLAAALQEFAQAAAGRTVDIVEILTVTAGEPDPAHPVAALFDALALAHAAGLPLERVDRVQRGPRAVVAQGSVPQTQPDGTPAVPALAHLTCVRGPYPPEAHIKAFGAFGSLEATLGDPRAGFPGVVAQVDASGLTARPGRCQAPQRLALIEAYAHTTGSRITQHSLSSYAGVAALAAGAGET